MIEAADHASANLITCKDSYTEGILIIDTRNDATYDLRDANDTTSSANILFNVDADSDMAGRAEELGLDPQATLTLAKVLSIATVRVLGADAEVTRR